VRGVETAGARSGGGGAVMKADMKVARDETLIEGARVLAHLGRVLEKACDAAGVTISQYRILSYVGFQAQRAGELADRAAVSRPTLTVALDTLEQRGLVRRERVPG